MQKEFILPDIGEGIVECELLEWLVSEGDTIAEDQPVAEVMTDKATVQIPAMHSGVVHTLHYKVGEIAKVHEPLFSMMLEDSAAVNAEVVPAQDSASPAVSEEVKHVEITGAEDFLLPDIGEGIVECEIVKWHVGEGDTVAEDQPVVEVMTDKAVVEIPAKHAGVLTKQYHKEGEIARVHAPLFALSGAENTASSSQRTDTKPVPTSAGESNKTFAEGNYEAPVVIPGKVLASPAVRRLARELKIDLSTIKGSGKKGRILKQDVKVSTEQNSASSVDSTVATAQVHTTNRVEKVRGVQAAMAKQMSASVHSIPHFSVSDELTMDNLIALRNKLKPQFEAQGVKLSFMPFFVKALSLALRDFPIVNSQLNEQGDELTYFTDHNIGVAVDSKIGLVVPNIKSVQTLSLFEVAQQLQRLIEQARDGKLSGDALKGGTISVSNIGALGGITATPVINKPEAAIVALGKTQCLPRFDETGNVHPLNIMMVNWSGDHRIIDGATMVKFNNAWCGYLSQPETMLMHLS